MAGGASSLMFRGTTLAVVGASCLAGISSNKPCKAMAKHSHKLS